MKERKKERKKERIKRLLELLAIEHQHGSNEIGFTDFIISLFKNDHHLFNKYLYIVFDAQIRDLLFKFYDLKNFTDKEPIQTILPRRECSYRIYDLKSNTNLKFPRPILSKTSLLIQIALLIGPMLGLAIAAALNFEFIIALHGVIKLSFLIAISVAPYCILYLLFPRFFNQSRLHGMKTYHDLISTLVFMNRYKFIDNEYHLTVQEISRFLNDGDDQ